MIDFKQLNKDDIKDLLIDAAKNWLAHDGLWFQAVERRFGLDTAIELDRQAWDDFSQIEAERIMRRLAVKPGGGIPLLSLALDLRLYAYINRQELREVTEDRCVLRILDCRVQAARQRKKLPDFPCKPVGIVEYSSFARTIDPRIQTRCLVCPPDPRPDGYYCSWEFTIGK
jgi:hypothetical protein